MGERVYIPSLGRFIQTDPIEGGADNAYVYPPDPVNDFDLDGRKKNGGVKQWFADRWNNVKNLYAKEQKAADKANAWCGRGYWNGVGCNAGLTVLTLGRGSRGGKGLIGEDVPKAQSKPVALKQTYFKKAAELGYVKRIAPQKAPFNSHGQPVFQKGNKYITPDIDSHKGGAWKMIEVKGGTSKRLGTYNDDLSTRVGD
jgi:hypothetical protein